MIRQPYTVSVALTHRRQIQALASFTKPEATVALQLLSALPETRYQVACDLKDRIDTGKDIALNGVPLSKPVAVLLALSGLIHSERLSELRMDLERIVRGTAPRGAILKPFLWGEGFRPKGHP